MPIYSYQENPYLGEVTVGSGLALIGSVNTISIGAAGATNIQNSAGWIVQATTPQFITVVNTATNVNVINTANLVVRPTTSATAIVTAIQLSDGLIALLSDNAGRIAATFFNNSTGNVFLKCGVNASTASFTTRLASYDYYELPCIYVGSVTAISSTFQGNILVSELA